MLAGDITALAEMLSDRLLYVHSVGGRDTKASLLAKISGGDLRYLSLDPPEPEAIVLGDTVLLSGTLRGEAVIGGQPRRLNNSTLTVWTAEDGTYRLIAYQPTPLP